MEPESVDSYRWHDAALSPCHEYLLPSLISALNAFSDSQKATELRVFDLGCGNGSVANVLSQRGCDVTGIDISEEGIRIANARWPNLKLFRRSVYDPLYKEYGQFPVVISLEVVEHLYSPRRFAGELYNLCEPNGVAIISTPFHGYMKNVALAVTGSMDNHFTALWDHGHIKFWSKRTITTLLRDAGFRIERVMYAGRCWPIYKSMIILARKSSH